MLSFHVKFVQTDGQTDRRTTVKQYAPDLSILGHKNPHLGQLSGKYNVQSESLLMPQ